VQTAPGPDLRAKAPTPWYKRVLPGDRAVRVLGLAVVVALAAYAARELDLKKVAAAFVGVRPVWLVLAMIANVGALWAQSLRWVALTRPVAPTATRRDAFRALVAGFALGLVMPARAADIARFHLLSRRSGSSRTALAATVLLDHVVGAATLMAWLGVFSLFAPLPEWMRRAVQVSVVVAGASAVVLFALRPRPGAPVPTHGVRLFVSKLRSGLTALGQPRQLGWSTLAGFAGWALEVAIAVLTLAAFDLPTGVEVGVLVMLASSLSSAISISPGNAGVFEVSVVLALSGFGVSSEAALAYAVAYHAAHLVPVALIGGVIVVRTGASSLTRDDE
jgi:glycosyltransferase AglD